MKRAEPDGEDRQFKERRTLGGLSGNSVTPPWERDRRVPQCRTHSPSSNVLPSGRAPHRLVLQMKTIIVIVAAVGIYCLYWLTPNPLGVVAVVAALILLPLFVYLFMSLMAAAARVRRGGQAQSREFARAGVKLRPFIGARVRRQDSGSLISTRAGIRIRSTSSGLVVGETRTIAKDVF